VQYCVKHARLCFLALAPTHTLSRAHTHIPVRERDTKNGAWKIGKSELKKSEFRLIKLAARTTVSFELKVPAQGFSNSHIVKKFEIRHTPTSSRTKTSRHEKIDAAM